MLAPNNTIDLTSLPDSTVLPNHLTDPSRNHSTKFSPMVFDIVKKEHGSTPTQEEFGKCTSCHQVLRARCSAPRITTDHGCSTPTSKSMGLCLHRNENLGNAQVVTKFYGRVVSLPAQHTRPRCRPAHLLNTDKGQLGLIWSSQIAMQVERHYFLCLHFAARNSYSFRHFQLFDFSILTITIHRHWHIPLTS